MLFCSIFQTFRRKNDSSGILKSLNPGGPLGSYLCDVTSHSFYHLSVSFLLSKENKWDFLPGEKNLNFFSFYLTTQPDTGIVHSYSPSSSSMFCSLSEERKKHRNHYIYKKRSSCFLSSFFLCYIVMIIMIS